MTKTKDIKKNKTVSFEPGGLYTLNSHYHDLPMLFISGETPETLEQKINDVRTCVFLNNLKTNRNSLVDNEMETYVLFSATPIKQRMSEKKNETDYAFLGLSHIKIKNYYNLSGAIFDTCNPSTSIYTFFSATNNMMFIEFNHYFDTYFKSFIP